MKRIFYTFLIFIAVSGLKAQDKGLIEVYSQVDTSVITIGDRINYSIIIDRDKNLRIIRPGEGLNLGGFEIKDYDFPEPEEEGDRVIERFNFNISVFDTGKYSIPAYPVAYFLDDTSTAYSIIEAPAIDIYVNSVLSDPETAELIDIKAPIDIPFDYMFWTLIGLAVILILAAVYLTFYFIKKRREKGYLFTPPEPPRPAHEVALEALEKLYAGSLLAEQQYKEFFSQLSDILRVYLEGRYYFRALEETTYEILTEAKKHVDPKELISDLKEILTLADLTKFAKYQPGAQEIEPVKEKTIDFINKTKIVFEPETTDQSESIQEIAADADSDIKEVAEVLPQNTNLLEKPKQDTTN